MARQPPWTEFQKLYFEHKLDIDKPDATINCIFDGGCITMKVGLVSDSHGNSAKLQQAIDLLQKMVVQAIVHCGDICSVNDINILSQVELPIWITSGNMDFQMQDELQQATRNTNITFELETAEIPIGNDEFMIATHGDDDYLLDEIIKSGHFHYICHGHTHRAADIRQGNVRLICPGSVAYPRGFPVPTAAIIDTSTDKVEFFNLSQPEAATPISIATMA
jgi:putative phosphoesterase